MLDFFRRRVTSLPVSQILIHCIILFLAIILGRVAVTANAIYIGLAVGLLLGSFLVVKPKVIIGVVLGMGLLVTGVLPLWVPSLTKLSWAVSLLGLLLLGIVFTIRVLQLERNKKLTPIFIYIALVFLIYSLLMSFAQWHSAGELFAAIKRYFQVWGVMFALAWLSIQPADIKRLQNFVIFVSLVQFPFALYELIKFVPFRENLVSSIPGLEPIDVVVGTFEGNLYGGGSNAEMATFQIIILAFLLSRWRENLLSTRMTALISSIVLAPLFLGETKIVVILLPMMFFSLYGAELRKNLVKSVMAIVAGLLVTILAGYVYVELVIGQPLSYIIEDTVRYNVQNVGYGTNLLNRTTVLSFWWEHNATDIVHFLTGHGLGSSHSNGSTSAGHVAKHYGGYGIGLTSASLMLWELGLIGLVLFLLIIVFAWLTANTLIKQINEPIYRADLAAIRAVLPMFIVYLFYRNASVEIMSFQIIFSMLLGYLAVISQSVISTRSVHNKMVRT